MNVIYEPVRATEGSGKDMTVNIHVDAEQVIVFTPSEKISIPKKELERLLKEFLAANKPVEKPLEKTVEVVMTRKEKNNA